MPEIKIKTKTILLMIKREKMAKNENESNEFVFIDLLIKKVSEISFSLVCYE